MRRVLILSVAFIVALTLVVELLLPSVVARGVEAGLDKILGPGETVNVRLKAYPALKMLTGRVDQVTVESANIKAAGLVIDKLTATIDQVSVNLRTLLSKRQIQSTKSSSIDVKLTISEQNLKQYVLANVKGVKEPRLQIEPGKVTAGGYLTFNGKDFFVVGEGRFVVKDATKVGLELTGLKVDDQDVPVGMINKVMEMLGGTDLFIDMTKFPIPLEAREVQMNKGSLVIIARGKSK
ncbi:MAG: LmeA family phospholipid-binding protein [Bacillota bacterium]